MKRIILIGASVLVILLSAVGLFYCTLPDEPAYAGQPLSAWLHQLDYSYRPQDVAASNAVFQMGTNILPFLHPMLTAKDSQAKLAALRLLSKLPSVKFTIMPAEEKRQRASRACRVLGPAAVRYLPELTAMLDSGDQGTAWCGFVAIAVVKPGAHCIPELTKALTNNYSQVRWSAASHLGNLQEQARPAVPALIQSLGDRDEKVRVNAIDALIQIHPDSFAMTTALTPSLNDKSPLVRRAAALALAKTGSDAESLKIRLAACLEDEDKTVRMAATNALRILLEKEQ